MTRRKTSRRRPTRMNKVITVAVAVVVLVAMAITCPKKQQHEDAVKEKMSHVMKQSVNESLGDNMLVNLLSGTIINGGLDYALSNNFCVKDYLLFSVGHFHGVDDQESTISFGIFNHVFTPSESRMRQVVDQQRDKLVDGIKGEAGRR